MPDLNWVRFYLPRPDTLVLGPFQGKATWTRIAIGKGVCGTATERRRSVLVKVVHIFPGHIACELASHSELVVPRIRDNGLLGVLDLDSPRVARFDVDDQAGCEALTAALARHLEPADRF